MNLFTQWDEEVKKEITPERKEQFWDAYFLKEKEAYEKILENKEFVIETTVKEFAEKYNLELVTVVGFIDGINTSLKERVELESLTEDSKVKLDIDAEKLLFNMYDAEAEWLYTLPQWNDILPKEKRDSIEKSYKATKTFVKEATVGRNDPCVCGSGKKFKKCCGK